MKLLKKEIIQNHGGTRVETYGIEIMRAKGRGSSFCTGDHVIDVHPYSSNTELVEIVEYNRYSANALKVFKPGVKPVNAVVKFRIRAEHVEFIIKCLREYLNGKTTKEGDNNGQRV